MGFYALVLTRENLVNFSERISKRKVHVLRRELIRAYYRNGLPEPSELISKQTNGKRLSLLLVDGEKAKNVSNHEQISSILRKHIGTKPDAGLV